MLENKYLRYHILSGDLSFGVKRHLLRNLI
nr:MAG TPA: hypothetical protein [Caudoviricetes sp.]